MSTFQGSFDDVKLPDVIQLMSVSSRTGCFLLSSGDHNGRIYLEDGDIVHAVHDGLSGEEAIYTMAIWDKGEFRFELGITSEEKTVTKRNTNILMEIARRLEEWRVLRKKVPSLDLIPELESLGHKKVSFNTQEWHVLSKINGVNSITQIAGSTNLLPMDVAKLIYGLVASHLVHLRETPKADPDTNPLEAREQPTEVEKRNPEEEMEWLSGKIERIYQESKKVLSELAHPVVQRHCARGVKQIREGKGISAVIETATQIIKAAQILETEEITTPLTTTLKKIIKDS
jgi:hypothetical protein